MAPSKLLLALGLEVSRLSITSNWYRTGIRREAYSRDMALDLPQKNVEKMTFIRLPFLGDTKSMEAGVKGGCFIRALQDRWSFSRPLGSSPRFFIFIFYAPPPKGTS